MRRPRPTSQDSGRLAVLHAAGGGWRVLIADAADRRPEILDAREFSTEQSGQIEVWLAEQQVSQILCVLPAASYICRTCNLPDVPYDALAPALELQVEAHLPDVVPDYRIGAAALDPATGESNRSGILIAWPESSDFEAPIDDERVRYVPDVAALAALMDGDRPADPLVAADPSSGSIAIALTHANGATFRAAKDSGESATTWGESVGRALAETALSVNHSGAFIEAVVDDAKARLQQGGERKPLLMLPSETRDRARRRVQGSSLEESWWNTYGVALGALLAHTGELSALTDLELAPPAEAPSRFDALVSAMSRPRTAVICAVICLLLLAFGPLAVHGTRLALLNLRYGDLDARMAAYDRLMAKREMYRNLQNEAWPMTKLLADLSTNTPPGIELDSVSISHGESLMATGLAIPFTYPSEEERGDGKWSEDYPTGKQDGLANIAIMVSNLTDSNIFQRPTFTTREPNAFGHYEFTIQAEIAQPYHDRQYPVDWDYAQWTIQQRIDEVGPGEEKYPDADGTSTATTASAPPPNALASSSTGGDSAEPIAAEPVGGSSNSGDASALPAIGPVTGVNPGGRTRATPPRNNTNTRSRPNFGPGATSSSGDAADRSNTSDRATSGLGPAFEIPEPYTQEQINAMDRDQVLAALSKVSGARTAVKGKDDELEDQLNEQFSMLMTRLREIGQVR